MGNSSQLTFKPPHMKRKIISTLIVIAVAVAIVIQFFRPAPIPQKPHTASDSFAYQWKASERVQHLLQTACYDCHSYDTRYPWYAKIQPIYSYMNRHIVAGEQALNFDIFGQYSKRKQQSKIRSMHSQIADGLMPLQSYISMHPEAQLSDKDRKVLLDWLTDLQD